MNGDKVTLNSNDATGAFGVKKDLEIPAVTNSETLKSTSTVRPEKSFS